MTTPGEPSSGPPPQGWGTPPGWATPPQPGYGYGYGQAPGHGPPPGWGPPPAPQQWAQVQWGGPHGAGPQSGDDTTWAVLAHLSYFVLGLVAPLVVYLVKKDSSPFVRQHAAEAFNFHVTLTLAVIGSVVLMLLLIGFLLIFVVLIGGAVLSVLAAVAAGRGEPYRYPLTIRFLR